MEINILSIPLWSDFIESLIASSGIVIVDFQSHYGLILSLLEDYCIRIAQIAFNPTMV